jgi:hypothetical protein
MEMGAIHPASPHTSTFAKQALELRDFLTPYSAKTLN